NIWLHSSNVEKMDIKAEKTSLLAHVKGGDRPVYEEIGGKSFKATAKYQNQVYYVKREAKVGSETFYLLSRSPSPSKDVLRWMKKKDVSKHTHQGVTKRPGAIKIKEKVGKNTWYRGKIDRKGSNIWLHKSKLEKLKINEKSTSRLGHIRGGDRTIYKALGGSTMKASAKHRDQVYYIKSEATYNSE